MERRVGISFRQNKHSGDVSVLTCADTGVIDTSENVWGTVLNAQTLEHSECIQLPGVKQILIIENKANYEAMPYRKDTLYLYCHGFFSPKEISFLKKIPEIYPGNERVPLGRYGLRRNEDF